MNKYTFINKEDLRQIYYFLSTGQHRYNLLMNLYSLTPVQMQQIVNDYIK